MAAKGSAKRTTEHEIDSSEVPNDYSDLTIHTRFSRKSLDSTLLVGALQLVTYNKHTQKIEVDKKAMALLKTIEKPVAVLAICGPYRSGKSYFLTRVLRGQDFEVGHKMDSCTKGIWMSTSILECEEFAVIVLDTEGIGAAQASEASSKQEVLKYLIITTLISSYLIFNTQGPINATHLQQMACFGDLSQLILISSKRDLHNDLSKHFPDFLWLMRDCELTPTDTKGQETSPTDYILNTILITKTSGEQLSPRDSAINSIRANFPSINCIQIPHPWKLEPMPKNPDFSGRLNSAIDKILTDIKVKCGFDRQSKLDGTMLSSLLEQYVKALNTPDTLPNLEVSCQNAVEDTLQHKVIQLSSSYMQEMEDLVGNSLVPFEEGDLEFLDDLHSELFEKALNNGLITGDVQRFSHHSTLFDIHKGVYTCKFALFASDVHKWLSVAIFTTYSGDHKLEEKRRTILQVFESKVKNYFKDYLKKNMERSQNICKQRFEAAYTKLKNTGSITLDKLRTEYTNDKEAKGPAKSPVLEDCLSQIPGPPDSVTIDPKARQLDVYWQGTSCKAPDTYEVSYCETKVAFVSDMVKPEFAHRNEHEDQNTFSYTINNLKPKTQYKVKVRGVKNEKIGEFSDLKCIETQPDKPDQPNQPTITARSHIEGTLYVPMLSKEKENGSPVTEIIVGTCSDVDGTWKTETVGIKEHQGDNQSFTVNIQCEGEEQALYFRVQLKNEAGASEPSVQCKLDVQDMIPGKPENFGPTGIKARQLEVQWNPPKVNRASVTSYLIQYSEKGLENWKNIRADCTQNNKIIGDLTPKRFYSFRIYTKSSKCQSVEYNCFEEETEADVPDRPQVRRIRAVSAENAVITYCRQPPKEENGSPVKKAIIEWSSTATHSWKELKCAEISKDRNDIGEEEITVKLTSQTEDITTYYRIKTVNDLGSSEPSQTLDLHPSMIIPGKVDSLHVKEEDLKSNSVILSWKEPEMNPKAAKQYEVKYRTVESEDSESAEQSWLLIHRDQKSSKTCSEYIQTKIGNLKPCTKHAFRVEAQNDKLKSELCTIFVQTKPSIPPTPRAPLLVPRGDKFELKAFFPEVAESGREVEKLVVYHFDNGGNKLSDGPATYDVELALIKQQDGGRYYQQMVEIDTDKIYWITLCLENEVGPSKESDMVGVSTGDVTPDRPDDLQAAEVESRQVKLFWNVPKKNGHAAKLYWVYLKGSDSESEPQLQTCTIIQSNTNGPPSYQTTVSGLIPFKSYHVSVRAINNIGKENKVGNPAVINNLQTKKAPPEKPQHPIIELSQDSPLKAKVMFKVLDEDQINDSKLESAMIEFYSADQQWVSHDEEVALNGDDLSQDKSMDINIPNLESEDIAIYRFRVRMRNSTGVSEPSEEFRLPTSQLKVGKPQNLEVLHHTPHSITLSWKKPKENPALIKGYVLEYTCIPDTGSCTTVSLNISSQTHDHVLENLKSNQQHSIKVYALATTKSKPAEIEQSTLEIYPSAPESVTADKIAQHSVKLRWSIPKNHPEEVLFYYAELRKGDCAKILASANKPEMTNDHELAQSHVIQSRQTKGRSVVFRNLDSYTVYTVSVSAHNDNKQKIEDGTVHHSFRTKMSDGSRRTLQAFAAIPTLGMASVAIAYAAAPDLNIVTSDEEFLDPNAYPSAPVIWSIKHKKATKIKVKWKRPRRNPDELRKDRPYLVEIREGNWKEQLEAMQESEQRELDQYQDNEKQKDQLPSSIHPDALVMSQIEKRQAENTDTEDIQWQEVDEDEEIIYGTEQKPITETEVSISTADSPPKVNEPQDVENSILKEEQPVDQEVPKPKYSLQSQKQDGRETDSLEKVPKPKHSFFVERLRFKQKIEGLEPETMYTISLSSYNYLDRRCGTVHEQFQTRSRQIKKPTSPFDLSSHSYQSGRDEFPHDPSKGNSLSIRQKSPNKIKVKWVISSQDLRSEDPYLLEVIEGSWMGQKENVPDAILSVHVNKPEQKISNLTPGKLYTISISVFGKSDEPVRVLQKVYKVDRKPRPRELSHTVEMKQFSTLSSAQVDNDADKQ